MSDLIRVDFYGDELHALNLDEVRVVVRRICDNLGAHPQTQIEKLRKAAWASCTATRATAADGKSYEMVTIPLRAVPMWLAGIDADRVAAHVREKLVRYQLECADVLARHFTPEAAPTPAAIDFSDPRVIAGVLQAQIEKVALLQADNVRLTADLVAAEEIVAEASDAVAFAGLVRASEETEFTLTRAAGMLQTKRNKLRDFMLTHRIAYRDRSTGDLAPMAQHKPRYLGEKAHDYIDRETGEKKLSFSMRITVEGIYWLAKKLKVEPDFGLPMAAE